MVEEMGRVDRKEGGNGKGGFLHVWRGDGVGDGEGGQEGRGQWGEGISQMECLGGDAFPKQRCIIQLVYLYVATCQTQCF